MRQLTFEPASPAAAGPQVDYPTLLEYRARTCATYPPAAVIAEKFQAMVALGAADGHHSDAR